MNELVLFGSAVLIIAAAVVVVVLKSRRSGPPADPEWLNSFSVSKYRPMERLLSESDFEFLAAQPGLSPRVISRLRRERRQIFRRYLASLTRDFGRLYVWAAQAALVSSDGPSDFAATLMRQRFTFNVLVWRIRATLVLHALGVAAVDPAPLLDVAKALARQARQLNDFAAQPAAI